MLGVLLVTAVTASAKPLSTPPPYALDTAYTDVRLPAFGLYASQSLKLNDGVRVWPWRMGSGGALRMGVGALACANAFVAGDFTSASASGVLGDVRLGGAYIAQAGAHQKGAILQGASLRPMRLALMPIVVEASTEKFVESGERYVMANLGWNYHRDVTVRANGTLVLVGNEFRFRSLVLNSGAKLVILRSSSAGAASGVTISVVNELLVDGAVMSGTATVSGEGQAIDGRAVLWKYHGANELHLNGKTRFLGALVAPNAKVSISSNAGFLGSLWARDIEIHQYNQNVAFLPYTGDSRSIDTDGDGAADTLEFRLGADPLNTDTDGDGYSDGLEIHGRQGLMGALKGVTATLPRAAHSWGWAIDTTRRDLFNPLRRDVFLRLLWQREDEIQGMVGVKEIRWDTSAKVCKSVDKYPFLERGGFSSAWTDPAWLDRMVEIFADPSDKPMVESPHSSRVPDYTAVLHVDAGAGAWRNLDSSLTKFGGEILVAAGGVNSGFGPYDFDINGDGRLNNKVYTDTVHDCMGNVQYVPLPDERNALVVKLFRGWTADPFRDCWTLGVGYGANGHGTSLETSEAPHHVFVTSTTSSGPMSLRAVLLHEYGHALGLQHPQPSSSILRDGVMNYAYLGGLYQRCHPLRGGTFADTRYCGDEPARNAKGWLVNDPFDTRFNVRWFWNSDAKLDSLNTLTTTGDTLLYQEGGPLNPRTGFRQLRASVTIADLRYSRGVYCSLDLQRLDERTGISICADIRGTRLAAPILGTPIDWNQNGVIDASPVDLWGTDSAGTWFQSAFRTPWYHAKDVKIHRDMNDWNTMHMASTFAGWNGGGGFTISIPDRRRDVKGVTSW